MAVTCIDYDAALAVRDKVRAHLQDLGFYDGKGGAWAGIGEASVRWDVTAAPAGGSAFKLTVNRPNKRRQGRLHRDAKGALKRINDLIAEQTVTLDKKEAEAMEQAQRNFMLGWCAHRMGVALQTNVRGGVITIIEARGRPYHVRVSYSEKYDTLSAVVEVSDNSHNVPLEQARVILQCLQPLT